MTTDLEARVRRLEDRAHISERVIKYAMAVDRADWEMFADCFTAPVHADSSENGLPAADFACDELVGIVRRRAQRIHGNSAPQPQPRHRVRRE